MSNTTKLIKHLQTIIPKKTTMFSEVKNIEEITLNSGVAAIKITGHGLSTGDVVSVYDIKIKQPIDITWSNNIATATGKTSVRLDGVNKTYTIDAGAYSGDKEILTADYDSFTFASADNGSVNGFVIWHITNYNGLKEITVVDENTFSYTTTATETAIGGKVALGVRIGLVATEERVEKFYTSNNENYLFVIPKDIRTLQSTFSRTDGEYDSGQDYFQSIERDFLFVLCLNASDDFESVDLINIVDEVRELLISSVVSYAPTYKEEKISYAGDNTELDANGKYLHGYKFTFRQVIDSEQIYKDENYATLNELDFIIKKTQDKKINGGKIL